jgi:hypothetical protein
MPFTSIRCCRAKSDEGIRFAGCKIKKAVEILYPHSLKNKPMGIPAASPHGNYANPVCLMAWLLVHGKTIEKRNSSQTQQKVRIFGTFCRSFPFALELLKNFCIF